MKQKTRNSAIPSGLFRYSADPGYEALVNSKRAAFIVTLIGSAVGEECVSRLTHILDHVHYDVLEYLGETGEEDA